MRGSLFTGGKTDNWEREINDFYATPPENTEKFLKIFDISKYNTILEPACGQGHMSKVINMYKNSNAKLTSCDLVDRGYGEVQDFFITNNCHYDLIITNPPFKYALEFIEKGLELSNNVVILAKIQLLEGEKRSLVLKNLGLKQIYGNVHRCNCWRNGQNFNPKTGKLWSGAMFLAWFVFEKGFKGSPTYHWLF